MTHSEGVTRQALAYVHAHFERPLGLGEVATALGVSASDLSAWFAQQTGMSFHRYLEELRLGKAKELLGDPRRRVEEVAASVGYANVESFRQAFETHTGFSPTAWGAAAT